MSEPTSGSLSLTLSRGITLLEYVCAVETAPSIGQVAEHLACIDLPPIVCCARSRLITWCAETRPAKFIRLQV